MESPEYYMQYALQLAEKAAQIKEIPVGAVIVRRSTGEIVGKGFNQRETVKHALAHAEIAAIDMACRKLGGWRLPDCAMFVTLEPCPMCAGAIIQAKIEEVWFGAYDDKGGALCSVEQMFHLAYCHQPAMHGGIMQTECTRILSAFFKNLRQEKRLAKQQKICYNN